jgi:hypothetical protein
MIQSTTPITATAQGIAGVVFRLTAISADHTPWPNNAMKIPRITAHPALKMRPYHGRFVVMPLIAVYHATLSNRSGRAMFSEQRVRASVQSVT